MESINEYKYKIESYERLKYEISRYIQTKNGNQYKKKLINIIENPTSTKKYKQELTTVVNKLIKILVASPIESKKKFDKVIKSGKYKPSLLRGVCFKKNKKAEGEDPHCACKGNKCKLVSLTNDKLLTERLVDLLLRYPIQRREILDGTI